MFTKIFKNTLSIVVIVVILCGVFIVGVVYDYFSEKLSDTMSNEAEYIAKGVELEGEEYLKELNNADARITWVASDGTVLFDNKADITTMDNHGDREEIKEAIKSSKGSSVRYSNTLSQKTTYHAIRINDGSVVRVAYTYTTSLHIMLGMLQPVVVIIMLGLVLSVVLTVRFTKQFIDSLDNIDLEHPGESEVYEELTPFIRKIIKQNKELQDSMEEQKSQREEFKLITENMQEGFIGIDKSTKILSYNTSALKLFGADFDVEQKSVMLLNRTPEFINGINKSLNGVHNEYIITVGERICNIYVNPVFDKNKVAGAIIIVTDVTEKEERENLRREFTANVSHELKTPLTSISGIAEIIKNGIVDKKDIPQFAGKIYDEARRLITLIEDIIKVSQLDESENIPDVEEIDLYDMALSVAEQIKPIAAKNKINIDVRGTYTKIKGVRPVIQEMLYNISENAVKYNKENGSVIINVDSNGKNACVVVSDTGIGIPEELHERIFERFYRVDKSHSKEIGGTGLGLSIVKHGAKIHGATIKVESKLGEGTKMTLKFPC